MTPFRCAQSNNSRPPRGGERLGPEFTLSAEDVEVVYAEHGGKVAREQRGSPDDWLCAGGEAPRSTLRLLVARRAWSGSIAELSWNVPDIGSGVPRIRRHSESE